MKKLDISRRTAIKTGLATAAFSIVPSRVLGKEAPSNMVHLAILGVGSRGTDVMRGFAHNKDARFIMVCDPFKSRQKAAADKLKLAYNDNTPIATTDDYREVMARTDIDGCVICSCDHWHVPLAIAAANSGKDVYVEKPLSLSMAWSWRLREAVARNGRIVQYGTQQRSGANFRYACQLVRNGYLGRIKSVDTWCADGTRAKDWMTPKSLITEPVPEDLNYDLWQGPAPVRPYNHYRVNREGAFHTYDYAIGFIAGWGAHPLDIAQWGLDMDYSGPVEYEGKGIIPTQGLYSTIHSWEVNCRYPSGTTMHFMADNVARPVVSQYRKRLQDHGTTFFGEEGWISVDRGGLEASDPRLLSNKFKPSDTRLVVSTQHDRNFIDCIRTREQPVSHLEAAIRSDTISHLSDIAIRLNRKINWDPKTETIQNDPQATRMLNRPMRAPYQI